MAQQHRSRNAPIINPFDQLPTPAFDAFVNDISAAIKNALNPDSIPVTSYTRLKHAHSRVPAPRFLSASSPRDTDIGDETGDEIREGVSLSHSSPPTRPPPTASSRMASEDDPTANGTGEGSGSPASGRAPIVVDLVSDPSQNDEESVAENEGTEEEGSEEEVSRYERRVSSGEEIMDSNEAGSWSSSASDASGEEEYDGEVMDDTFEMQEPRVLSSFKGKARAADEGPGVRALRGISERMRSLPHQAQPTDESQEEEEEEEDEEDSPSWASDDGQQPSDGQVYSQRDGSDDQLLFMNVAQSADEHDTNGGDSLSRNSDGSASSVDHSDREEWKERHDNGILSISTAFPEHEVISLDDSPLHSLGMGEQDPMRRALQPTFDTGFAGDNGQILLSAADQPHHFFSDTQEGISPVLLAQVGSSVEMNVHEAGSVRCLDPSFETVGNQWDATATVVVDSVPLDNLVTEDEYAEEDTGDYGAVGDDLLPQLQNPADTDYAFNVTVNQTLCAQESPALSDPSASLLTPTFIVHSMSSERTLVPTPTPLGVLGMQSSPHGPVDPPDEQRCDVPIDEASRDATRTPSPPPPSFAVWPHTRDPTPLSPAKQSATARASSVQMHTHEQLDVTNTTPSPRVEHSQLSTEVNAMDRVADTGQRSNVISPGDLPDTTFPPPTANLAPPSIPSEIKRLSDVVSTSVVVQPPPTPLELSADLAVVDDAPPIEIAPEISNSVIADEIQSSSPDACHKSSHRVSESFTDSQELPCPAPSPSANLSPLPISSGTNQPDDTVLPDVMVHVSSSPRGTPVGDAEAVHDLSAPELATISSEFEVSNSPPRTHSHLSSVPQTVSDPLVTLSPSSTPEVPGPHPDRMVPSVSLLVHPPTTPPTSPSASVKTAKMTSPALDAARRLPLSVRISALRRSISGSGTPDDSSVFLVPRSPVSVVEAHMPLTEAALNAASLQAETKSKAPPRTDSLEVEPPTPAILSDGHDSSSKDADRLPGTPSACTNDIGAAGSIDISSPKANNTIHVAEINGADDQAPSHSSDLDCLGKELDGHAVSESEAEHDRRVDISDAHMGVMPLETAETQEMPPQYPADDTSIPNDATEPENGEYDNEVPWLKVTHGNASSGSSASEISDLLEGTTTSSTGGSQTEGLYRRRSTRKRKRNESIPGSDVATTPAASPTTRTKVPGKSKGPSRLPRGTIKVPTTADEPDARSTISMVSDTSRTSRMSRRKSRPALTVLLPAIHHFHNHAHQPPPSASESSPHGHSAASQTTTGLVTRSQCRFHKVSAPGLVPETSVFFIVPGCALSATKVMKENQLVDCGLASAKDNASKITNVSQLPTELASVLRQLVGHQLMHEGVCGYLSSQALQNDNAPSPEDTALSKGMEEYESDGGGPPTPRSLKSPQSTPGRRSGRKRAPRRSNPRGDLADYIPSDADPTTDTESNLARHKQKHRTGLDLATLSMDPNGLLSLGTIPNAGTEPAAVADHDSTSTGASRRNRGRKRRRDGDVMAYKPGAESNESDDDGGAGNETPHKPKRRRGSQHQPGRPENVVIEPQYSQGLNVSVEVPRPPAFSPLSSPRPAARVETSKTAAAMDGDAHQLQVDMPGPPRKKGRKWWSFAFASSKG